MNHLRRSGRLGAVLLSLCLLLVACSAAATPPPSPGASEPPDAPVSAPPSDGSDGVIDPGGDIGDGKFVVPKPGQLDVHDVQADSFEARVDGSNIILTITWTSGVEPCTVLDQIAVTKGSGAFAITLREGRGPEDVVCIAIAEVHKTEITIPTDGPGTYRIIDSTGGAEPIEAIVG